MKKVFKYKLETKEQNIIALPVGYEILSVQSQNDDICVWVKVDDNERKTVDVCFWTYGTGHEITAFNDIRFIGSVHLHGGFLVFHVFVEE